jgi:uncharacterized protein (TIGR02145 family)
MKNFNNNYLLKRLIVRNVLLMILLFIICPGDIYSQRINIDGNTFRVYGKEIFINGVNTPWDNWNDFGGNYDHNFWNTEFQEIRQAGGNASRIWITCNGDVGINISTAGLVSGATLAHWEDLDDMFALAEQHQVYIMATLTSFDHTKNTYTKYQSWRNMLADNANVSSYVNNYVIPFINRYKDNPYLWCIDVCNEIEWMHENSECGSISWDRLHYFVSRVAAGVHENSNVLVTLGSAAVKWNSNSPGCEGNFWSDQNLQAQYNSQEAFLDFYSPHFYGWVVRWFGNFALDKTPDDYGMNDRPCMVGENPARGVYKQNTSGQDELIVPISEAYIKTYQQGWKGLMVWTSNGVDGNGSLVNCGVGLTAFQNQYPELVSPSPPQPPEFDSIIDIRDGQIYKIVKIGGLWWMAENLNIGDRIPGGTDADTGVVQKYCYNDNDSMCDIYGGLYQWYEMMDYNLDNGFPEVKGNVGICPAGWHVPGDSEWEILVNYLGGSDTAGGKLKDTILWNSPNTGATNETGFTALPGGGCYGISSFNYIGTSGFWWSSTVASEDSARGWYMSSDNQNIVRSNADKSAVGWSVRCIKDGCLLKRITMSKSDVTCHGISDGLINLSVEGTGPFTFNWSTGDTTQNIQNLEGGWYKVIVTDRRGCSMTDSAEILEPEQLIIFKSDYSDFICSGSTEGFVKIGISGGVPPYSYSWSNGKNSQNILNIPSGNYSVTIKDQTNCQITESFTIQAIVPYDNEEICLATFDPQTGKNLIIWEKTPEMGIKTYKIYRETVTAGDYNLIGTTDFESPGFYIDENSNPATRSYKYKISVVDTCGNESDMSFFHKTITLQQTSGSGGPINLMWEKYEGFEVQRYNIWRGSDINNMSIIATVSGEIEAYADTPPLPGTYIYQLEAVSPYSCNPDTLGTVYTSSLSYLPVGSHDGIYNLTRINTLSIFPNPFNESTTLNFNNPEGYNYKLYLKDLSGKVYRIVDGITTSEFVLEKGDLMEGFYFVELRGPDIYRGKIIIE